MQAALSVRVSTDRQQQAHTIKQQVASSRATSQPRRMDQSPRSTSFATTAAAAPGHPRPGLDALRDHAARAAVDLVVICSPDRLARNFVHQLVVVEEVERRGGRVVFGDRPLSDDPYEQLVTQIRGAVAAYART